MPRLLIGPDVFFPQTRGFVSRLLPDLEFRHRVVEGRGSESRSERVGAKALEIADAGAPQCPLQDPRHPGPGSGRLFARFPRA